MVINTLIKSIDEERIRCIGYSFSSALYPKHWFQFADDSALVTSTEKDCQLLLNIFTKWCCWAKLIVRVDKCCTFGIKKNGNKSTQYHPYLKVNNEMIPPVKINDCFVYLGKFFSFNMKCDNIKQELKSEVVKYIDILDRVPLHPKNKLMILSRYVYSKLRWRLSIYNLTKTWVIQNLDSLIIEYVKRWLSLPQGANTRHLFLPTKHLGLKFSLPSDIYDSCQLTTRKILDTSENREMKELYSLTKTKYSKQDNILHNNNNIDPKKHLQISKIRSILDDLTGLKEQNTIIRTISELCTANSLIKWQKICDQLPENIFKFIRKALIFNLPVNSNLQKWKRIRSNECNLCKNKQTQLHVLNNCPAAVNDGRYTWRHNSILYTICYYLNDLVDKGHLLFADIEGYRNTFELFHRLRPDVAIVTATEVIIVELTCCFETNLQKSREYKIERYRNIGDDLIDQSKKLRKVFIEISSLGFHTKQINDFKLLCKLSSTINIDRLMSKLSEVAIRCSYYIYTQRNNNWTNQDVLKFY